MRQMYQRDDDPMFLTLEQAFTNAKPADIIKVMPCCPYCTGESDLRTTEAYLDNGVWLHGVWVGNKVDGVVICKRTGS